MPHRKRIDVMFRLLPFSSWKDALLRRHIENCPACQARLASREDARRLLVHEDEVGDQAGLWPAVRARIKESVPDESAAVRRIPAPGWKWAVAMAGLFLAVFMTFAVVAYLRTGGRSGPSSASLRPVLFEIYYAKVAGRPADTIVIQRPDEEMIFVWVERSK